MNAKKIILLDGNNLVCRAFFALPASMTTKTGQPTNAAYGFATMLIKLIGDYKPDQIIAAFDLGKSKRAAEFAAYKAHRPSAPEELKSQFPLIKEMLNVLKIPLIEIEGEEADDILATMAKRAEGEGSEVYIVTNDKDVMQLVGGNIQLISSKKGLTDTVIYDREGVIERFGVAPEHIIDYLGLKGDSSDNIPGVSGVGEKTAQKLVSDFGSLEEIYERLDELSSDKLRAKLTEEREIAFLSKRLATLDSELDLPVQPSQTELGSWSDEDLAAYLKRMEFISLISRFAKLKAEMGKAHAVETGELKLIEAANQAEAKKLREAILKAAAFSFILTGDDHDGSIFATGPSAFISLKAGEVYRVNEDGLTALKEIFKSEKIAKITYDAKTAKNRLAKLGIELLGVSFDPMIAAYLIDPLRSEYPLLELLAEYLGRFLAEGEEEGLFCAFFLGDLAKTLKEKLVEFSLDHLFDEIELPLAGVLADMERAGVGLDLDFLKRFAGELEAEIDSIRGEVFTLCGCEFNLNSSKQLGEVLFEKLGLKCGKKTKTGYSTDSSVLASLAAEHPAIEKILKYREIHKLLSTYLLPLPKLVDPGSGRLRTSFNQTVTATGRLSSSNPNLQNIPIRTELGIRMREAFIPGKAEDILLVADYSQIELRILAHLSGDENLIAAFNRGEDIHTFTASEVFSVAEADVTAEMRRAAKAVNFGIVYGLSPFGLSEQLKIDKDEAARYIDDYFARYPAVKRYIDNEIKLAYEKGFARTISGRMRRFPELKSQDYKTRGFGERLAVNFPIQGTAADIIKIAMVRLAKELKEGSFKTKMILQVHDELVFEAPKEEAERVSTVIERGMEGAVSLKVGLEAKVKMGHNWRIAK